MKVLILDCKENQAVATMRSLAKENFYVVGADDTRLSKAFYSKSCREWFVYPSPRVDVEGFLDTLLSYLSKNDCAMVFPMTEKTIWPLSLTRDSFFKFTRLPIPSHDVLLTAFDKRRTIEAAKAVGVPVPITYFPVSDDDVMELGREIRYPVVVKQSCSENIVGNRVLAGGAPRYADNLESLKKIFFERDPWLPHPMVQEFIPGSGMGIFTIFRDGVPLVWFAHKRIRDVRPTGSGSSLRESIDPDPVVKDSSERLLRSIAWEGVAMVEFRRDSRDGMAKLMEINGRFWNSLPLSVASGIDFPMLLYKVFSGEDTFGVSAYRRHVKCRWMAGDIRHLLAVLRGKPREFTGDFPERLPTILTMIRDTFDNEIFSDVWSIRDPLPAIVETLEHILRAIRRVTE